jgi:hypothetical protein
MLLGLAGCVEIYRNSVTSYALQMKEISKGKREKSKIILGIA